MTRLCIAALLAMFALSGCASIRIGRLEPALKEQVRAGRLEEAAKTERQILRTADEGFGPESVETVGTRESIAKNYALWKLTDRALSLAHETVNRLDPKASNQAIVAALLGLADIQNYAKLWQEAESTTDRVVELCNAAPPHVPTYEDPYDECHFARYRIDDDYLEAGAVEKFAREYLSWDETQSQATDREGALSKLTVLGRGYASFGVYREAIWYIQRCVDENRVRYERRDAPPAERHVASTASGDVHVFTLDGAHSFHSQSPRCLADLITLRRLVGAEAEAAVLEQWQQRLWSRGPDLEAKLLESMRRSDEIWHDGYHTSREANNLAFYYANKGRTHDAIRTYEKGIQLIDDHHAKVGVFGDVFPIALLLDELLSLGAQREKAGLAIDAAPAYSRAVDVADRDLHPKESRRLESRAGLARSLAASGQREKAIAAWREYLDTAESMRGTDHPEYAVGLSGLADAIEAKDRQEAERLRRQAEKIRADARRRVAAVRDLPLPVALRSSTPPAN